jgi:exopolyphosphatase/guanosine-5'-triphosphate,3'-diphosphate pyrophosphatase
VKNLLEETLALRARYDDEPSHSDQVAHLALGIFDGFQREQDWGARDRELLHSAALLHDIGWSQTPDGRGHHKESARLIREHSWRFLAPEEIPLVALVARYHRRALPSADHSDFQVLDAKEKQRVMGLGGILRIADALDRTHTGRIRQARAESSEQGAVIYVRPQGDWRAERDTFAFKCDLLEAATGRAVRCEAE